MKPRAEFQPPVTQLTRTQIELPLEVRLCREEDLFKLEWYGMFYQHRNLIRSAYERQNKGENVMIVAFSRGEPVGQVWIDLTRSSTPKTGFLWAIRVFPLLQGFGIGTALLAHAESWLVANGFVRAELGVEFENKDGERFYRKNGYQSSGAYVEENKFTSPDGIACETKMVGKLMYKMVQA